MGMPVAQDEEKVQKDDCLADDLLVILTVMKMPL